MIDNLNNISNWQDSELLPEGEIFQAFLSQNNNDPKNICNGIIIRDDKINYKEYILTSAINLEDGKKHVLNLLYGLKIKFKAFIYNGKIYEMFPGILSSLKLIEKLNSGKINIIYKIGQLKYCKVNDKFYLYLEFCLEFKDK